MNCYDESHGYFANQGGYKGWRRGVELIARMKAAKPGLFIQGFYGTKNFGLWGLKNVDQHEVYNKQSMCVSTRHNQISDDRQNADGLRFQNNWSMRLRFSPAVMGHALTHRVSKGGFNPKLIKAWDYAGWQYGVMSALAVSGSVMPTILPYETNLVPGYVAFYKKWLRWARDKFAVVNCTEPFGEQVQPVPLMAMPGLRATRALSFCSMVTRAPPPSRLKSVTRSTCKPRVIISSPSSIRRKSHCRSLMTMASQSLPWVRRRASPFPPTAVICWN
jgi:hypothetical protein